MNLYECRTFKSFNEVGGGLEWFNRYLVSIESTPNTQEFRDVVQSIGEAESHLTMPHVWFNRVDAIPIGTDLEPVGNSNCESIRFHTTGTRVTDTPDAALEPKWALLIRKQTDIGRSGRLALAHSLAEGDTFEDAKGNRVLRTDDIYLNLGWHAFRDWIYSEGKIFYVAHKALGGSVVVGMSIVRRWEWGTVIKRQSIENAQSRKRQEGLQAEAETYQGARQAHDCYIRLREILEIDTDPQPLTKFNEAFGNGSACAQTGDNVNHYFTDFDAPPIRVTRWTRPQADPGRAKAATAAQAWKETGEHFKELIQQIQPDPEGNVEFSKIEPVKALALSMLTQANIVMSSRFT